jgi:hypothetical protein
MTSQEINNELETLALEGLNAEDLILAMRRGGIELNADNAKAWVAWGTEENARAKASSPLNTFERMVLIYLPRCKQVHDSLEIGITPEQWAKNIAREAVELFREKNEGAALKLGAKVIEVVVNEDGEPILDANGGKQYVADKFGIVIANPATAEAELQPFADYEHRLDDLRVLPEISDEDLPTAVIQPPDPEVFEETRPFDPQYVEFLSELICVEWFNLDGTKVGGEYGMWWHIPEELEELQ